MASLRNVARELMADARDGIGFLVIWKGGRSWFGLATYSIQYVEEAGEGPAYEVAAEFIPEMKAILERDPKAICVNPYIDNVGPFEDMTLESLMDGIKYQREINPGSLRRVLTAVEDEDQEDETVEDETVEEFEVYENNAGALFLAIMEGNRCKAIFENWEYMEQDGSLLEAIGQLQEDPDAWRCWEGDCYERLHEQEDYPGTLEDLYGEIRQMDDLVAWGRVDQGTDGMMMDPALMGCDARKALGVREEDEDD